MSGDELDDGATQLAAPQWLRDDEQRAWRGFLRTYAQVQSRLRRQLQRDTDLSLADYEVLVSLSESPEPALRPFQIGIALHWEKSRLSHQLTRMEKRGLLTLGSCVDDGRGALVAISKRGRVAIEAAAPLHVAEVRRAFLDGLQPHEITELAETFDGLARHLAGGGLPECSDDS